MTDTLEQLLASDPQAAESRSLRAVGPTAFEGSSTPPEGTCTEVALKISCRILPQSPRTYVLKLLGPLAD
jgi:hypothetical protein